MIKKTSLVKVNLYISSKQRDDLKELANRQSVSYATLIRLAINDYISKNK